MKVTDEKRRIRSVSQRHESDIRIRLKMSRIRNTGFEGVLDIRYPGYYFKVEYTVCNKASVRVLYCTYVAKRQNLAINKKMYFSVEACAKCGIAFVGEEETSGGAVKLHILDSRTGIILSPGSTYSTVFFTLLLCLCAESLCGSVSPLVRSTRVLHRASVCAQEMWPSLSISPLS